VTLLFTNRFKHTVYEKNNLIPHFFKCKLPLAKSHPRIKITQTNNRIEMKVHDQRHLLLKFSSLKPGPMYAAEENIKAAFASKLLKLHEHYFWNFPLYIIEL